jgi:ATP-dependent helicase YprA (DUF1998 family)
LSPRFQGQHSLMTLRQLIEPDVPADLLSANQLDNLLAFSALKLHPTLLRGVDDLGFVRPTPIQSQSIPPALEGRDLLANAVTGSGKTAAFLLPILHQLVDRPRGTTRALVLAPTRELALQILDDLKGLARHTGVKAAAVHGGVNIGPQEKAFRDGADVIIATPGRLPSPALNTWFWMKPTECWTWVSCPISGACSGTSPGHDRRSFSAPPCLPPSRPSHERSSGSR